MSRRTLICCAHPFGYGPAAKLLHIVRLLRDSDFRIIFLGTGISHELASRSDLFDEVVHAAPTDQRSRLLIGDCAGLLSLMDRDYSAVAVELGRPIFVADSLLWMREQAPAVFRQARRYWAQEFIDVKCRLPEVGSNAALVGPIVGPPPSAPERGIRVVVNLGGGDSPTGSIADDPIYLDFVLRGLMQSELGRSENVMLLGGEQCARYLRSCQDDRSKLEIVSLPHDAALSMMQQARVVITSPGLTATLECFQAGVPTLFLPPQNYSQWWILKKLRERGLAPHSFHWADVLVTNHITERMSESERGPLVREAIRTVVTDHANAGLLAKSLADAQSNDLEDLACHQRCFFASLGGNGTEQIAEDLQRLL